MHLKRIIMLLTVAAIMALMMSLSAGPASAQVALGIGDTENESGDITMNNSFSIEGNNNNACLGQLQFDQTGNFTNQQGTEQFISPADDIQFAGGDVEFAPANTTECTQAVQQSAAASSWGDWSSW